MTNFLSLSGAGNPFLLYPEFNPNINKVACFGTIYFGRANKAYYTLDYSCVFKSTVVRKLNFFNSRVIYGLPKHYQMPNF